MRNKNKAISKVIYWGGAIIIPMVIAQISGIVPPLHMENITTIIFLIVTLVMYIVALVMIQPIISINDELVKLTQSINNADDYKTLNKLINNSEEETIKGLYKQFCKELRFKEQIDDNGEITKSYYRVNDANDIFDDDNLIYKKIREKTITHITQALTGVGIFGTFLGIVKGVSQLNMNDSEAMKSGILVLLSGVKVSFNSSLYGILFSLILVFVFKITIDIIEKNAYQFSDRINDIIPKYIEESSFKELNEELKKQTSIYEKLSTDIAEEISKKFDLSLEENIGSLTSGLERLIFELQENLSKTIISTNENTSGTLVMTMKPIMEKLETAITGLQSKQEETTGKFIEESIMSIKGAINAGTNDEITKLKDSMELMSTKNSQMIENFVEAMENMQSLTTHQENLVKNANSSTETMNMTTENIKELQAELTNIIIGLREVNVNNTSSIENVEISVKTLQNSMESQLEINKSLEDMVVKSNAMISLQDQNISKFATMTDSLSSNIDSVEINLNKISQDISNYKKCFSDIQESTMSVANRLDVQYKGIVTDLEKAGTTLNSVTDKISSNVLEKVNNVSNLLGNIVKDLNENQEKSIQLTNRFDNFANAQNTSVELWASYKESFDNLNENLNDGIVNYNKLMTEGAENVLVEYDAKVAQAIEALSKMVEMFNESVEDIKESLEPLENIDKLVINR